MLKRLSYYCFVLIVAPLLISACSIQKGYEALNEYNYFEAKKNFEKSLKRNESPAAYGLSVIYFREDNPFHNIDSAYHYSLLSVESYEEAKEKKHKKWLEKLDFNIEKSKKHRDLLGHLNYEKTVEENKVEGFKLFISKYPWSKYIKTAEIKRDSLAFLDAKKEGTSVALADFLEKYQENKWSEEAQELLEEAQYHETIIPNNTQSYMEFIHAFPKNPMTKSAHLRIYEIETQGNSIAEYNKFIKRFPNNPNVEDAWVKLYRLSIADYKKENIEEFAAQYPNFPFPELISRDLGLVGQTLFQFTQNGKYGFMDETGAIKIPAKFEYTEQFKNGLALVFKNDLYGYINKNGELMIDYQFEEAYDFDQGRAVVVKNDKYGLIDVSGNFIIEAKYDDIGPFIEGLTYVESEKGYQYYTLNGALAFPGFFDEAFSFENGLALVRKENKSGYISKDGTFFIAVEEGTVRHFSDSIFVHELRGEVNFMVPSGTYLYEESFDQIGVLQDDRAIVTKEGKYGYFDSKGKMVIPLSYIPFPNYMQFAQFKNNHAIYRQGDLYGMINKEGKKIFPALFKGIGTYAKLTPITKGRDWGYANENVNLVIKYQFDYANEFINDVAIVEKNGLYGLINLDGKEVLGIEFESIKRLDNNLLLVESNEVYSLYSNKGVEMIETKFSRLIELSKDIYQLIAEDKIMYYDVLNNRLITLQE